MSSIEPTPSATDTASIWPAQEARTVERLFVAWAKTTEDVSRAQEPSGELGVEDGAFGSGRREREPLRNVRLERGRDLVERRGHVANLVGRDHQKWQRATRAKPNTHQPDLARRRDGYVPRRRPDEQCRGLGFRGAVVAVTEKAGAQVDHHLHAPVGQNALRRGPRRRRRRAERPVAADIGLKPLGRDELAIVHSKVSEGSAHRSAQLFTIDRQLPQISLQFRQDRSAAPQTSH